MNRTLFNMLYTMEKIPKPYKVKVFDRSLWKAIEKKDKVKRLLEEATN
jgi:hypothetical protein